MWKNEIDSDSVMPPYDNDKKFKLSNTAKLVLKEEIKQWVKKFMPQAKDDAINFEVDFLFSPAYSHLENYLNTSRKLRSMDSIGDGNP